MPRRQVGGGIHQAPNGDGLQGWCKVCKAAAEMVRRADGARKRRHLELYATDTSYRAAGLLRGIKKRARRLGLDFDLTEIWLGNRLERGVCELSGVPLDMGQTHRAHRPGPFAPSVDRIEAGGPYTMANCRVIAMALNWAFNDWGLEAFLPIALGLAARVERARRDAA